MKLLPNVFELPSLRREGRNWNHSNKKYALVKVFLIYNFWQLFFKKKMVLNAFELN